ncbi:MAG: glutamine amidotransferase [Oscillospiraceae bacterium]
MCGIAGILSKTPVDIAQDLVTMLSLIQHRGPDAAGVAIFKDADNVVLRVTLRNTAALDRLRAYIGEYGKIIGETSVTNIAHRLCYEFTVDMDPEDIKVLHERINSDDDLAVHSISNHFKVYKEGGLISNLTDRYELKNYVCRHGIGHVRMATESAEDVNAAHPFVSPFYPELAIVHNGQFTNYFNMRRFLESKGAKFKTLNDSEAASHLIAYAMQRYDGDLKKALEYAGDQMDGIYCIIASTPTQIGFVKDKLGIKPLLVAETDDCVMLGSEQIEFNAIGEHIFANEMEPGEVRVWNV